MNTEHSQRLPTFINPSWRVAIVHSCFYEADIAAMIESAREVLLGATLNPAHITVHPAAGSFEVPLIGAALAEANKADAMIGLGIIVEGETHHGALLAAETARGIMDTQLRFSIPFAFEILYVKSLEQARKRADKGAEAAYSALHSLAELHRIRL